MVFDRIYGNDLAKELISSQIEQKKLAHAFIIEGPRGSGKTLLAKLIAASMTDNAGDVEKILSNSSPDVIVIDIPERAKTIGINAVREIREKAYLIPNDLEYKVFIIESADELTLQAQNALLKIIEEPPNETYFLILARSSSNLLPTVRSRAVLLRMQLFSDGELYSYLEKNNKKAERLSRSDPDKLKKLISGAAGTVGRAIELLNSSSPSGVKYINSIFKAVENKDRVALISAVNSLPSDRDSFENAISELRCAVRDGLAAVYSDNAPTLTVPRDEIANLSSEKLFQMDKVFSELQRELTLNPNIQTVKYYIYTKLI